MATDDLGNTGSGGALTDTDTSSLSLAAVNDGPVNTLPATYTGTEDQSVALTGISVADVDSAAADIKVTFSVPASSGILTLDVTVSGGVTAAQVTGNGTNSVVITAPLAALNTTLAAANGLRYAPAANLNGTVTLTMATSDQGNTGSGGALTDTDTSALTINAVNDAPRNTLPGTFTGTEDQTLSLTGISVADVDAGAAAIGVTFSVPAGTGALTLDVTVAGGVTAGQVTGNGTGAVTITAPLSAINATLASATGLSFAPTANLAGPVTVTMVSGDLGNAGSGGPRTDTDSATLNLSAVNDAPVNTLPGSVSTNQNSPVVLTGISVADLDAGTGAISVVLNVTGGSLAVNTGVTGGVTAAEVTSNNTGLVTLTSTLARINATLAHASGLTYSPASNFNGTVTLTMVSNDLGNSGSGGALSDTDTSTLS